jgi:hypothetical protein
MSYHIGHPCHFRKTPKVVPGLPQEPGCLVAVRGRRVPALFSLTHPARAGQQLEWTIGQASPRGKRRPNILSTFLTGTYYHPASSLDHFEVRCQTTIQQDSCSTTLKPNSTTSSRIYTTPMILIFLTYEPTRWRRFTLTWAMLCSVVGRIYYVSTFLTASLVIIGCRALMWSGPN